MAGKNSRVNHCQNPTGWLGRLVLRNMNSRHSKVTDWGLSQASIGKQDIILDVGCGGGRTVSKLAAIATQGKVYGIDHSPESVAMAMRINKQWIDVARVEVREASVSRLPFSEGAFDVVTAVETHFWWSALPTDLREVLRVLKPGGRLIIIAEVYKGAGPQFRATCSQLRYRRDGHNQSAGKFCLSSEAGIPAKPDLRTRREQKRQWVRQDGATIPACDHVSVLW